VDGREVSAKEVPGQHHFTHGVGQEPSLQHAAVVLLLLPLCGSSGSGCDRIDSFGAHDWYHEGARVLVETQAADGSWGGAIASRGERRRRHPVQYGLAILFLRRATRPLIDVASVDRVIPNK
jgi:hypothetical protein